MRFGNEETKPTPPKIPSTPANSEPNVTNEQANSVTLVHPGRRLAAVLLDNAIFIISVLAITLFVVAASKADQNNHFRIITWLICLIFVLVGCGIVILQLYLLSTQGQTLGKKWMGIKIVNISDNSNPGFVKAVLCRTLLRGIIASIPGIGAVFVLIDDCFVFREDRRCIHDLIAGTKVVKI